MLSIPLHIINTVISCISKSDLDDSAERAERWLQRMIDLYNENPQNDKIQPDTVSFNSVIHAYSNTPITKGAPERAKKAKELLNQRTMVSGNHGTGEPRNQITSEPGNQVTREAGKQGAREPVNQGTSEPGNQRTREP